MLLPGGFAYGDYLRAGVIARFSPVMRAVAAFADAGGPVLGICNGFQVLAEAGLVPGALLRNRALRFVCREVTLLPEHLDERRVEVLRQQRDLAAHEAQRAVAQQRPRHEARLREHLEAVADPEHRAALIRERRHGAHHRAEPAITPARR